MTNETLKKALLVYRAQKRAGLSHILTGIGTLAGAGAINFGANKLNQWNTDRLEKQLTAQGWVRPKPETPESIKQKLMDSPDFQQQAYEIVVAKQKAAYDRDVLQYQQLRARFGHLDPAAQQHPPYQRRLNIQPEPQQFSPYGQYGVNNWADMQQPLYGPRR